MKTTFLALILSLIPQLALADAGADCRLKTRKVACPAQCNPDEEIKPQTAQCVFSKEQYKKDGIGCIRFDPVCWCDPVCPVEPSTVIKL